MRSITAPIILILCLAVAFSGCATMRYPGAYKIEGEEFKEFKELDDERALKLVALIYNVNAKTWEDGIARSITLDAYLRLLAKRKTRYIRNSGVFEIKYDKVNITKWEYDDLAKLYDLLEPKTNNYYMDSAPELSESENARRVIYLTSISALTKELKGRDAKNTAFSIVGQALFTVLSVALAMI